MVRRAVAIFVVTLSMIFSLGVFVNADPNWKIELVLKGVNGESIGQNFIVGCAVDAYNTKSTTNTPDPYDVRMAPLPPQYTALVESEGSTRWIQDYRRVDDTQMLEWSNIQLITKGNQSPTQAMLTWKLGTDEMIPPKGMHFILMEADTNTGTTTTHDLNNESSIQISIPSSTTEETVCVFTLWAIADKSVSQNSGYSTESLGKTNTADSPLKRAMESARKKYAAIAEARVKTWGPPVAGNASRTHNPSEFNICTTVDHFEFTSPTNFVKAKAWNLVSIPAIPVNPDPVNVFDEIHVTTSSFQYWSSATNGYVSYGSQWTGPITPGQPYWFLDTIITEPKTISVQGYQTPSPYTIHIPAHPGTEGYWITFANPFEIPVVCDNIRFTSQDSNGVYHQLNWEGAFRAGWVASKAQGFDNSASNFFDAGPYYSNPNRFELEPWYGYWLLITTQKAIDIQFVAPTDLLLNVNSTGSMGDENNALNGFDTFFNAHIGNAITQIKQLAPETNFAFTTHKDYCATQDDPNYSEYSYYGDSGDAIVTLAEDFTDSPSPYIIMGYGGSGLPDSVTESILFGMNQVPSGDNCRWVSYQNRPLSWRSNSRKVILTIGDAGPHDPDDDYSIIYEFLPGYFAKIDPYPIWVEDPSSVVSGDPYTWKWTADQAANLGYKLSFINVHGSDTLDNTLVSLQSQAAYRDASQRTNGIYRIAEAGDLTFKDMVIDAVLGDIVYSDDFEFTQTNAQGWVPTGLWNYVTDPSNMLFKDAHSFSKSHSWWYGHIDTNNDRNYDTGTANSGSLTSPGPICIPNGVNKAELRFMNWYDVEFERSDHDLLSVQIAEDNNGVPGNWINYDLGADLGIVTSIYNRQWTQIAKDLTDYKGKSIWLRFVFNTVDNSGNNHEGWYIDNIEIVCH